MAEIHPTAIIDPLAHLAADVKIGAYAIIKGEVHIGEGTVVHDHTHIHGCARIGRRCKIGPAAYVGLEPQHLKYNGELTWTVVGDDVVIRETATIHRSFHAGEEHATRIGDRCFIMAAAHVAHDCSIGNDAVLANAVLLAGHCTIGQKCFLGGGVGLHQFCRVGRLAIIAGNEGLSQDIPPFASVRNGMLRGYNAVGCRRNGLPPATIVAIRAAYHRLAKHRIRSTALAAIRAEVPQLPEVVEILAFIEASKRGIVPSFPQRAFVDTESRG